MSTGLRKHSGEAERLTSAYPLFCENSLRVCGGYFFSYLCLKQFNMLSEITQITGNGTYDGPHGLLYKFEYSFKDGAILTARHKTPNSPFKVGDVAEYEIKGTNDYGSWGKVQKPDTGNFNGQQSTQTTSVGSTSKDDAIMRQTAVKCAAHFYSQRSGTENDVIATAMRWYEWMKTGDFVAKTEPEEQPF